MLTEEQARRAAVRFAERFRDRGGIALSDLLAAMAGDDDEWTGCVAHVAAADDGDVDQHLPHGCDDIRRNVADARVPISYSARFREYHLRLSETVGPLIAWCPWCGARLPPSLRDEYFDEMDRLGVEDALFDPPPGYADDAWWRAPPS